MADSDITISALSTARGQGQVVVTYTVDNPLANGLPYLQLDKVEVWASTSTRSI